MNVFIFFVTLVLIGTLADLVRLYCKQHTIVNKLVSLNYSAKGYSNDG